MIGEDNRNTKTQDTTHKDSTNFQNFLFRIFRGHEYYERMWPDSSQPVRFFATTKNYESIKDISVQNLTLRPIISQTGTWTIPLNEV